METPNHRNQNPNTLHNDFHLIDISFSLDNLELLSSEQLLAIQYRPDCTRNSGTKNVEIATKLFLARRADYHVWKESNFTSHYPPVLAQNALSAFHSRGHLPPSHEQLPPSSPPPRVIVPNPYDPVIDLTLEEGEVRLSQFSATPPDWLLPTLTFPRFVLD